jgi:hypothetical protein
MKYLRVRSGMIENPRPETPDGDEETIVSASFT